MRRILGFWALVAAVGCQQTTPPSIPAPQRQGPKPVGLLHVEQAVIDLGDIEASSVPPKAVFRLVNRGTGPVTIKHFAHSCTCSEMTAERLVLAPGQSSRLTMTIKPGWESGPRSASVRVQTDAPIDGTVPLTATWNLRGTLELRPHQLVLGDLLAGEELVQDIHVFLGPSLRDAELAWDASSDLVSCTLLPPEAESPAGANRLLRIVLRPEARLDRQSETVRLSATKADAGERPVTAHLNLTWHGVPRVSASPPAVVVARMLLGTAVQRTVVLKGIDGPVAVAAATASDGLEVTEVATDSGRPVYRVVLRPERTGVFAGHVDFRFRGNTEALRVAVSAAVEPDETEHDVKGNDDAATE